MLFEMIGYSARNFAVNQTAKLNCGLLKMNLSSLAGLPHRLQKGSGTLNQTKLLFPLIIISLEDEPWEPIEPNPNAAPEDDSDVAEQDLSQSDWTLASTETVTHEYLTQSGKVVRETITTSMDTTTLDFFYDESGRPFAFNYTPEGSTPNTYYYILNLQGDVVQIIDANGVMQAEYVYSPWGEVISAEGDLAEVNPLRYRGYYYDSETGFYYLQSRYYDPENHRFINADTYASTDSGNSIASNMFAYCGNNPVMRIDIDGRFFNWITGAVGAVVGAAVGAISAAVTGGDAKDILIATVSNALAGFVTGASGSSTLGRAAGAAINAGFTYLDSRLNGVSPGVSLINAGVSAAFTFGTSSISGKTDVVIVSAMCDATVGFGGNLAAAAEAAGTAKAAKERRARESSTARSRNAGASGNRYTRIALAII